MVANPWWNEKNYFEESKKNQDLSPSTKSPIEIKDVHIEFDNMHNNDTQNGKLVYIIWKLTFNIWH